MPITFRSEGPPPPARLAASATAQTVCVASLVAGLRAALAASPAGDRPVPPGDEPLPQLEPGAVVPLAPLAERVAFLAAHAAGVADLTVRIRARAAACGVEVDHRSDHDLAKDVAGFVEQVGRWRAELEAGGADAVVVDHGPGTIGDPALALLC